MKTEVVGLFEEVEGRSKGGGIGVEDDDELDDDEKREEERIDSGNKVFEDKRGLLVRFEEDGDVEESKTEGFEVEEAMFEGFEVLEEEEG